MPADTALLNGTFDTGATLSAAPGIEHEKFVLPNGLTLIVHEDRSAPVVAMTSWFHVGSKDERAGRTGFAHLFEHLLFKGAKNYPGSWHGAMKELGATNLNGTTSRDRTNFFQTVPVNALDRALAMEADRVENLHEMITEDLLKAEISVVLNEKRQREGAPYAKVGDAIIQTFYPQGHPYAHSVIGTVEDVSGADLGAVADWRRRFYGAANTVIVLAGDISPEEGLAKVTEHMGHRFPGEPVLRIRDWVPQPPMMQQIVMEDHVPLARSHKIWRTPGLRSDAALDLSLFASLLSKGAGAPLRRRLMDEEALVTRVAVSSAAGELAGEFIAFADIKPGVDPDRVEAIMDEEIRRALDGDLDAGTLERLQKASSYDLARSLEGLEKRAELLAGGQTYFAAPEASLQRHWASVSRSLDQVLSTACEWLSGPATSLVVLPYTPRQMPAPASLAPPAVIPPEPARFPGVHEVDLKAGPRVYAVERARSQILTMKFLLPGLLSLETIATRGTASLMTGLLAAGGCGQSKYDISERFEAFGLRFSASVGMEASQIDVSVPRDQFSEALPALFEVFCSAEFPAEELARNMARRNEQLRAMIQSPQDAGKLAQELLTYGASHMRGLPAIGLPRTLEGVTPARLGAMRDRFLDPGSMKIILAGDLAGLDYVATLEACLSGLIKDVCAEADAGTVERRTGQFLLSRRTEGQAILGGLRVFDDVELPSTAAAVFSSIMGAGFNARLNQALREERGWSYGANGGVSVRKGRSSFGISASVQADRAGDSLEVISGILSSAMTPGNITAEEVETAKDHMRLPMTRGWPTAQAVVGALTHRIMMDHPADWFDTAPDRLAGVTCEDVQDIAARVCDPQALNWVVTADPQTAQGLDSLEPFDLQAALLGDVI